jgi:uncharacterized protein YjbI with pentapeptide repeats
MATFNLNNANTGVFIRTMTGDSFSRAVEAEVRAGRSLANADLQALGKNGDPTELNLSGGTFTNAKMDGVNLTGSLLHGADITGASLKNATLRYVKATRIITTNSTQTGMDKHGSEGNL